MEENPIDKIMKRREPKKLPRNLTKEQVDEMLGALETAYDKTSFTGLRNITLVQTYLHTGLRRSELMNLRTENLRLNDGYLRVDN